jgi:hypothetical protein
MTCFRRVLFVDINNADDLAEIIKLTSSEAEVPEQSKPVYALESLPELLGERQFKMLCDALGIQIEPSVLFGELGNLVAQIIQNGAERQRRSWVESHSLSDELEEMLK